MDGSTGEQRPLIMFVDDNPALLDSVEQLLIMEGFDVLVASDGQQALEVLAAADPLPELIISEVMMPVMDGFALFEEVRRRREWYDIQFLFLTARDQIADLERAYNLGVDDFLVKPFDHERLVLIVRGKIRRRREWKLHLDEQQRALNRAKQDLAMLVAHELRTPLVSISMVSDILSREISLLDRDQVAMMLDTMQGGSQRLVRLVEQMVLYVQLESGALRDSLSSPLRESRMYDLVIGAVERARQFAYRRPDVPVRLEEYSEDLVVCVDAIAMQHALAEVLANAMLFSAADSEVFVRLWAADGMAWFCVADWGRGIPADEVGRVFEPFYQVDRRRQEQQGIGIGLTLAREVVRAHGGLIALESSFGNGTEVRIGLPMCQRNGQ